MSEAPPESDPIAGHSFPSSKDYKRFGGDAVMVPDKGFLKQLKMLDPEYEVVWDWGSEKWEIWKLPKGGDDPYPVMTVQTKGRSYRELGTDLLVKLQFFKRFTPRELGNYLDELDNQVKERKARDFANKIESITLDNFNWMRGVKIFQVPGPGRKMKIGRSLENG